MNVDWFKVISKSMYPIIDTNDRILIKNIDSSKVKKGDIILFKSENIFIIHRVIGFSNVKGKRMILQKGDANEHASLIDPESVLGKVIVIEKNGKLIHLDSLSGKLLNKIILFRNNIVANCIKIIINFKTMLQNHIMYEMFRSSYHFFKKPIIYLNNNMLRSLYYIFSKK